MGFEDVKVELLHSVDRASLVIGHPGHELRVFGWLSSVRPRVFILTDGSGTSGVGRLASTARVLSKAGVPSAELSAVFSDAAIYQALLDGDIERFTALVDELSDGFIRDRVELVVSDANEGFNPTHDLCREITSAAVEKARLMTGRNIMHYEFCLTEWRDGAPDAHDERCVHVRLNDADLVAKIEAAYEYRELRDEVDQALAIGGQEYFREECLRRLDGWTPLETSCKPQYEVWGEQRVAEGKYKSVLRFREHMLPVLLALRSHAFLGAAVRSEPIRAVNLVDMELSLP